MIELRDVVFRYPSEEENPFELLIDRLEIGDAESVAIAGPSGSGKTTLLNLISGNLRPSSGTVIVGSEHLHTFDDRALCRFRLQQVGQVFQTFELLGYLSTVENVMLPWIILRTGRADEVRQRAMNLLDSVGLGNRADDKPDQLSHGERQRVAVCRALLNNPELLLADEPTGNLDQANKQNVVDLLIGEARRRNSTLLMVTHDVSLLDSFDRTIQMQSISSSGT